MLPLTRPARWPSPNDDDYYFLIRLSLLLARHLMTIAHIAAQKHSAPMATSRLGFRLFMPIRIGSVFILSRERRSEEKRREERKEPKRHPTQYIIVLTHYRMTLGRSRADFFELNSMSRMAILLRENNVAATFIPSAERIMIKKMVNYCHFPIEERWINRRSAHRVRSCDRNYGPKLAQQNHKLVRSLRTRTMANRSN